MQGLKQLEQLNKERLYSTAVQLGSVLVSQLATFTSSSSICSQLINVLSLNDLNVACSVLYEYGVALRFDGQPMRGRVYLYQTLCILYHLKNHAVEQESMNGKIFEVCEQMGHCCLECEDMDEAFTNFEGIPQEMRSLSTCMTLGSMYQRKGDSVNAIASYQMALKKNPFALSAVQHLIELSGQQVEFIKQLYPNPQSSTLDKFMHCSVDAIYAKKHHKYKRALRSYEAMNQIIPNNPEVLAAISECKARVLDIYKAKEVYDKAKSIDSYLVAESASYALLLRRIGEIEELQKVCFGLLKQAKKSPEAWATMSIYYEAKGQYDKALKFAQQSIDLDSRYVMGYLLKANILSILSRFAEAVTCYHEVHFFSKDIRIYQGLVNCYMSIPQIKDALSAAQMAAKLHPHHFKSAILLGNVYNLKNDTRDAARQEYERAIQLCQKESEPCRRIAMEECILGLVDVEIRNNNVARGIQLIKDRLEEFNSDTLYTKLGELYVKAGNHVEAMHQYQIALGLNSKNEHARRGIDEIELLMQPEDADELNDEGDAFIDEEVVYS